MVEVKFSEVYVYIDGDTWCARIGENLQVGVAGYGITPEDALQNLSEELRLVPWNWLT